MEKIVSVKIIEDTNVINWEPWVLLVAVLSLIASVLLPFSQKMYEEYRAKRNFQYYLKKQFGLIFNFMSLEKIEYTEPSVKNEPKKEFLELNEYVGFPFLVRFKSIKNTVISNLMFLTVDELSVAKA